MTRTEIETALAEYDGDFLLLDGFDDAFVGVVHRKLEQLVACYDRRKCIEILMTRDGMTEDEAEEFFQFNVEDAWVGPATPVFLISIEA